MTTTVSKPSDLLSLAGTDLGSSDWLEIPQSDIDLFATATHDEQWIHVDVERARTGPFKGTIAHGYLTLSLLIPLWPEILVIEERGMAVNYGLNKLRFPAPVPAGSKLRLKASLAEVTGLGDGAVQVSVDATMEREGGDKPVCIAQLVHRNCPGATPSAGVAPSDLRRRTGGGRARSRTRRRAGRPGRSGPPRRPGSRARRTTAPGRGSARQGCR